jgi:hypothetical protein
VLAVELSGRVFDDRGRPFADAPVLVRDPADEQRWETRSDAAGNYRIAGLEAGTYTLVVSMPCCALATFVEDALEIAPGGTGFDIHLVQGDSLNTFGDDPATVADLVRDRQEIPDLPVPRREDGRPDLSGVWLVGHDPFPAKPDATEWAQQIREERAADDFAGSPHNSCLPGMLPIPAGGSPFIGKLVHTDELLVILFDDVPGYRQIFLDGRSHPEDPNPAWMGHSVGRWEDDTLVVETIGFNDRGWLLGFPMTEAMRMVERYQRSEFGRIELQVTFEDPAVFRRPFVRKLGLDLAPQEELIEYVCENNKWFPE